MNSNQFKTEVDNYFTKHYDQLMSTTGKIIKKHKSNFEPSNLLSLAYLYIMKNEEKIILFADTHHKTVEHTIYGFVLTHINRAFYKNGDANLEDKRLFKSIGQLDAMVAPDNHTTDCAYQQDDLYTEDFINEFYLSLDKLDGIAFRVYYYDGIDNAQDFAKHFGISKSSAYSTINKLKTKLIQYIHINKIH